MWPPVPKWDAIPLYALWQLSDRLFADETWFDVNRICQKELSSFWDVTLFETIKKRLLCIKWIFICSSFPFNYFSVEPLVFLPLNHWTIDVVLILAPRVNCIFASLGVTSRNKQNRQYLHCLWILIYIYQKYVLLLYSVWYSLILDSEMSF